MSDDKQKKDPETKKKKISFKIKLSEKEIIGGALGVVGLIIGLAFWTTTLPSKGPIEFGVCRTFAELQLKYPHSLKVTTIDRFRNAHEIFYTFIDAFGMHRSNRIECTFTRGPEGQLQIASVSINGKPFTDREQINYYNMAIPAVIAANPDLHYRSLNWENLASLKSGY